MLKFLILLALTIYVISKIGGFFFRIGAVSEQQKQNQANSTNKKKSQQGKIKGGEYIDFEEIK